VAPDPLFLQTRQLAALRDRTAALMPAAIAGTDLVVHRMTLPPDARPPFVLLQVLPGGRGGPIMAGDPWAHLEVQATSVGRTGDEATAIADLLRWHYVGRDDTGAYASTIDWLGDSPVLRRGGGTDPVFDTPAGVPQVVETFAFELGRGAPPP
jgi:hypothetical protein